MDVIPPHFTVSTAFFCSCFFHQFLKSLQEKGSCSVQILRSVMREKCISSSIEVFERLVYLYFVFDHLLQELAQIILQLFVFIIEEELLPVLRLKEAIMKYWFYFAYFVLKNIHFVFWNISQGSCPWVFLHGKIEI